MSLSPPKLTARELDVMRLVAEGLTNDEIGRRLYVTGSTVKAHLTHVANRLGTGSRAAMVATLFRSGVLS